MNFSFGFARTSLKVEVPAQNFLGCLQHNQVALRRDVRQEVESALEHPIASSRLRDLVQAGEKVVIITSDITRPMPSKLVLPLILEELSQAGVRDSDVTIVFGLGIHRPHTEQERRDLVGDAIYERINCIDSDPTNCVHLGYTTSGTPVDIFRPVAEADRRICLGNIEYHYFAGYSGGAKAIMPGVSTRAAIQANHQRMVEPEARAGQLAGNPVRSDIDEVARFVPIDFMLNVILDEHKNIAKAFAGHYVHAHREGCKFLDSLYQIKINTPADIVITSPGGHPKDLNLYQAQKALDNAQYAVKDGGIIILVASCAEGLGEQVFEQWVLAANNPNDLRQRLQSKFELGGHKAVAIARVLQKAKIYLVSQLEPALVNKLFMQPYPGLQEALDAALGELGQKASVLLMPYGGSTLPVVD